jgi:hypothetical protein
MLKLSTKCWIPAFNAQGSRGIIVAVQVGAVKIYVAAVEVLKKEERQGETQETIKFLPPPQLSSKNYKITSKKFHYQGISNRTKR